MQNFVQEDSQIAPSSHAEISNTDRPGLVASPPSVRQPVSSRDGRLDGRATTGHLQHPTQSHADMFLTLKARLEVLSAWIYWYLYVSVIERQKRRCDNNPQMHFQGCGFHDVLGIDSAPLVEKLFRELVTLRAEKNTHEKVFAMAFLFSGPACMCSWFGDQMASPITSSSAYRCRKWSKYKGSWLKPWTRSVLCSATTNGSSGKTQNYTKNLSRHVSKSRRTHGEILWASAGFRGCSPHRPHTVGKRSSVLSCIYNVDIADCQSLKYRFRISI